MQAGKFYVTIPAAGSVAVEHKLAKQVLGAHAVQDPSDSDESGPGAYDVTWNTGKFVTVSGPAGRSCIVLAYPDTSITAAYPSNEAAPAPGHVPTLAPLAARRSKAKK